MRLEFSSTKRATKTVANISKLDPILSAGTSGEKNNQKIKSRSDWKNRLRKKLGKKSNGKSLRKAKLKKGGKHFCLPHENRFLKFEMTHHAPAETGAKIGSEPKFQAGRIT